ncbi:MAG: hypothetical protein WAX80_00480 [Minisyncoccia bacterium]
MSHFGVNFVLHADDKTRRAIKLVNLFTSLVEEVALRAHREMVYIRYPDLHIHFPEFVRSLGLDLALDEETLYRTDTRNFCRAVALCNMAYSPSWGTDEDPPMAYIHYLHEHSPNPDLREREIVKKAEEVGVNLDRLPFTILLDMALQVQLKVGY